MVEVVCIVCQKGVVIIGLVYIFGMLLCEYSDYIIEYCWVCYFEIVDLMQ